MEPIAKLGGKPGVIMIASGDSVEFLRFTTKEESQWNVEEASSFLASRQEPRCYILAALPRASAQT